MHTDDKLLQEERELQSLKSDIRQRNCYQYWYVACNILRVGAAIWQWQANESIIAPVRQTTCVLY